MSCPHRYRFSHAARAKLTSSKQVKIEVLRLIFVDFIIFNHMSFVGLDIT